MKVMDHPFSAWNLVQYHPMKLVLEAVFFVWVCVCVGFTAHRTRGYGTTQSRQPKMTVHAKNSELWEGLWSTLNYSVHSLSSLSQIFGHYFDAVSHQWTANVRSVVAFLWDYFWKHGCCPRNIQAILDKTLKMKGAVTTCDAFLPDIETGIGWAHCSESPPIIISPTSTINPHWPDDHQPLIYHEPTTSHYSSTNTIIKLPWTYHKKSLSSISLPQTIAWPII